MKATEEVGERKGGACALDGEIVCLLVCMKVGFCRVEGSSVLLLCNLIGDSKLVNSICHPRLPKISGAGDSIRFGSQIKREGENVPEVFAADNRKHVNQTNSQ